MESHIIWQFQEETAKNYIGLDARKSVFVACEQQRRRSASYECHLCADPEGGYRGPEPPLDNHAIIGPPAKRH